MGLMGVEVDALRPDEHIAWDALWSQYQKFYGVSIPATVTERLWARIHGGHVKALGARTPAGALVGIAHFHYHEDTWSAQPACYLQDLFVDPAERGGGCGRKLIEAVAAAALRHGASAPYWLTHESNSVARRLYDRLGRNHGFIQYTYATLPRL